MGHSINPVSRRLAVVAVLSVCALLSWCASGAIANPAPAPSAFQHLPVYGITPVAFSSSTLGYTLTISSGAYLVYNSVQYPITLTWAFYAVNDTGSSANDFQAAGADISEWKWDQHPNNATSLSVAGWLDAPKHEAIVTPLSGNVWKSFTYSTMQFTGVAPVLGLHVTVSIPSGKPSPFAAGGVTGSIIPDIVPEPGSLLALASGLIGLSGLVARRRSG